MIAHLTRITARPADSDRQAVLAVDPTRQTLAVDPDTHPAVWRALTGRQHPDITRMHRLWRARRGTHSRRRTR